MQTLSESIGSARKLYEAGDRDAAEEACWAILDSDARCGDALHLLGLIARDRGSHEAAVRYLREAATADPDQPAFHAALAGVLTAQGEFAEAATALRQVVRLQPGSAEASTELAMLLRALGEMDQAIASFERAVQLTPEDPFTHLRLFTALHCRGDFERGWIEYDWRLRLERHPQARLLHGPQWDGSPLNGRTILLAGEGGIGDQIQFVRYARLVKERGGFVVVTCIPRLRRLFQSCPGIDRIDPWRPGDPMPACDTHAFQMSLPRILHTTPDTVPAEVPYLAADPLQVECWRNLLRDIGGFRVGINWEGNRSNLDGRNRALPPEGFLPLVRIEGVRLLSLQKGPGTDGLAKFPEDATIVDLGQSFRDLADTAAAMEQLDLVITNDTSIAHLAGALGKPVWVLLSSAPCWRWLEDRDYSPWYPTMRLFRRRRGGSWDDVFARVETSLRNLVGRDTTAGSPGTGIAQESAGRPERVRARSGHVDEVAGTGRRHRRTVSG